MPLDSSTYVHRSGRTGRAGKMGDSVLIHKHNDRSDVFRLGKEIGVQFKSINSAGGSLIDGSTQHNTIRITAKHPKGRYFPLDFEPLLADLLNERPSIINFHTLADGAFFDVPVAQFALLKKVSIETIGVVAVSGWDDDELISSMDET